MEFILITAGLLGLGLISHAVFQLRLSRREKRQMTELNENLLSIR